MVNPLNIKPVYQGSYLSRGNISKVHQGGGGGRPTSFSQRQPKRNAASIGVSNKQIGNGGGSESGYSADRESLPNVYSPFVSVNLHPSSSSSTRYDSMCPKRRKKNEMQFALTTIKEDLKRAGIPYKTIDTKNIKTLSALGNVNINLQDHVRLVRSGDYVPEKVLNPSSSNTAAGNATRLPSDYMSLHNAVRDFYPSNGEHTKASKKASKLARSKKDTWSTPNSSSDISDTESDSGSGSENDQNNSSDSGSGSENDQNSSKSISNSNSQCNIVSLSPLLEDSLDSSKIEKTTTKVEITTAAPTTDLLSSAVSASKPITMVDILQLSKTARVVTNASVPFSIIHANAAFYNLLGKYATDAVIGESLFSLLDPKSKDHRFEDELSLAKFMLSSSSADISDDGKKKLCLLRPKKDNDENEKDDDGDDNNESLNCFVRMSPILSQKDGIQKETATTTTSVGYFAIEFVPESKDEINNNKENSSIKFSPLFSTTNNNTPMGVVA